MIMKRLLLLSTILVTSLSIYAEGYDIVIDGIYYKINAKDKTAEVTNQFGGWSSSSYSGYNIGGTIIIPESIEFKGATLNVVSIGDYAFYSSGYIGEVILPDNLKSIGVMAFADCPMLTSISIPQNVEVIEDRVFFGCSALTSVTIPNSVTSIGDNVFDGCTELTSVSLDCSNVGSWFIGNTSIKEITLGEHVTSIGISAFGGCSGLTSITIGSGVTSIGKNAFGGCSGLKKVIVSDIAAWCGINFGGFGSNPLRFAHLYSDENTEITDLVIPSGVTSIGDYAFSSCFSLTSITIPNSVTHIGVSAFENSSGLTSIEIPNSVTSMGDRAFTKCAGLTSVTIGNSVTSIGDYAFFQCRDLTSVTIGNSVTSIGDCAFQECLGLVSIALPNSVTSIGIGAFENCGLTSIEISNSLTSINIRAFLDCSKLTSIEIPDNVKTIYDIAFNNCKMLKTIKFGKNLELIVTNAFDGCTELTDVYCYAKKAPNAGDALFKDSWIEFLTLHVPYGTSEQYKAHSLWSKFGTIVEMEKTAHVITYMVDGEVYKTEEYEADDAIVPLEAPTKEGYTFSGWSEIPETMPAHDVTVTGTFSINTYKIVYMVDGVEYRTSEVTYGAEVNPIGEPSKEGYIFSGWMNLPEEMPAHDVTVTGTFTVNSYKVTFVYGDSVLTTIEVKYGAAIELPTSLNSERYTLVEWKDVPDTMPAHDITIYADYVDGINTITADRKDEQYIRLNGMYTPDLKPGLNIIRMKDGTTQKVWVK